MYANSVNWSLNNIIYVLPDEFVFDHFLLLILLSVFLSIVAICIYVIRISWNSLEHFRHGFSAAYSFLVDYMWLLDNEQDAREVLRLVNSLENFAIRSLIRCSFYDFKYCQRQKQKSWQVVLFFSIDCSRLLFVITIAFQGYSG